MSTTASPALRGDLRGVTPFRGLGRDISGLSADKALTASGLDWKVGRAPVDVRGHHGHKWAEGYQALVRSDNGHILDITSNKFKVHQNADTMGVFAEMASAGGLELVCAGELDGGAEIFSVAKSTGSFEMKIPYHQRPFNPYQRPFNGHSGGQAGVTDRTELNFILRSGHRPGSPTGIKAYATRLWCMNGCRFTETAEAAFRLTHRSEFSSYYKDRVRDVVTAATLEFATYEEKARRMLGTPMSREESEAIVLQLLQPELLAKAARTKAVELAELAAGRSILDRVLDDRQDADMDMGTGATGTELAKEHNRGVKLILGSLDSQPGAVPGTAWNTFNAITHYVDHVRGRSADSGVRASLFGDGDRLKKGALDLVVEFTMANGNGRDRG